MVKITLFPICNVLNVSVFMKFIFPFCCLFYSYLFLPLDRLVSQLVTRIRG